MDRFMICSAFYIVAERYHSGQWSKGYSVLSRLARLRFQPARSYDRKYSEERSEAARLLWKRRREIKENW
jgi:hypothetical protein